ncbi:hypothetical protein CFAM422_005773 [Trichoderma lentiforme]|uniref:Uncharacterized protein n=1 Tax=Trichoderma lentiforme TaxID=1567552 RepID=A0A9P4XGA3_9HYPO|nr:hypothetical protein CFAM422_005773 [Trichoderma lentiforme]
MAFSRYAETLVFCSLFRKVSNSPRRPALSGLGRCSGANMGFEPSSSRDGERAVAYAIQIMTRLQGTMGPPQTSHGEEDDTFDSP